MWDQFTSWISLPWQQRNNLCPLDKWALTYYHSFTGAQYCMTEYWNGKGILLIHDGSSCVSKQTQHMHCLRHYAHLAEPVIVRRTFMLFTPGQRKAINLCTACFSCVRICESRWESLNCHHQKVIYRRAINRGFQLCSKFWISTVWTQICSWFTSSGHNWINYETYQPQNLSQNLSYPLMKSVKCLLYSSKRVSVFKESWNQQYNNKRVLCLFNLYTCSCKPCQPNLNCWRRYLLIKQWLTSYIRFWVAHTAPYEVHTQHGSTHELCLSNLRPRSDTRYFRSWCVFTIKWWVVCESRAIKHRIHHLSVVVCS